MQSFSSGLTPRQVRLVMETIQQGIDGPLPVAMLSSAVGLSPSHFGRAFRASIGCTPHRHVVRTRVRRAMKLMAESNDRLSTIALAAGFADQAHLSRTFRRYVGLKPLQWRRMQEVELCA